jgi:hypothetical protein
MMLAALRTGRYKTPGSFVVATATRSPIENERKMKERVKI